jgi:hypothetical protein
MLLLKSDQASAAVVFATLNTTRARLDLVQRLAKITIKDRKLRTALEKLIERFNEGTHIRNEFNHCMYLVNDRGEITHTQSTRIVQSRNGLAFGEKRAIDDARIREITAAIREMKQINRDIWDFMPRLDAHLRRQKSRSSDGTS